MVCNVGCLLSLFFAINIFFFLLTYIFSALYAAVRPLWETLLVEEIDDEGRAITYSTISIINFLGNISTPIAGLLLKIFGIIRGFRIVVIIALFSFIAKTLVLMFKLIEYPTLLNEFSPFIIRLKDMVKVIFSNVDMLMIFIITIIMNVTLYSLPTYLPLYLKSSKGTYLSIDEISLIPYAFFYNFYYIALSSCFSH